MKQSDEGCATIYLTREEAAVLIGAVQTGMKNLTAYWTHKDFDKQHESEVVVSMRVMTEFIDRMDKIINDEQIRAYRIAK